MYSARDTNKCIKKQLYPAQNTTARHESMVESGMTEGGKNTARFYFGE